MSEKKVGKRLLTWVLVLVMTLSLLPLNVLAAENDTPENTNPSIERSEETLGAYLVKSATKDGDTYKIQLESWVTGKAEQTTGSAPLDIVLVLDQSGSMEGDKLDSLKKAVSGFVDTINEDAAAHDVVHRIAIVGFASNGDDSSDNDGKWKNTGLFVNGEFKKYITYTSSGYDEVYDPDKDKTYYVMQSDLFGDYAVEVSYDSEQNSWGYLEDYLIYEEWVKVTPKQDANDTDESHTQFYEWREGGSQGLTDQDYQDALVSSGEASIKTAISKLSASGATRASYGMEMANNVFANNELRKGSSRVVVFFTDGEPGRNGYNHNEAGRAIAQAHTTKNNPYNAKVFSVGMFDKDPSTKVKNFMNHVSSNYPDANASEKWGSWKVTPGDKADTKYYMTVENDNLSDVFETISGSILNPNVAADASTVLTDKLSQYFDFDGVSVDENGTVTGVTVKKVAYDGNGKWASDGKDITEEVTVGLNGKTVTVKGFDYSDEKNVVTDTPSGYKLVVTFNVKPDTNCKNWTGSKEYETNNDTATLANGNDTFATVASPKAPVDTYKVTYQPGTGTGNEYTDQYYLNGAKTPVKANTFTAPDGYEFDCWKDDNDTTYQVGADITFDKSDVTLTAQWKEIEAPEPALVTLTANSKTFKYDGQPHDGSPYSCDDLGLLPGHTVESVDYTCEPQTNVGTYDIKLNNAKIVDADGKDVTALYQITYNYGKLIIDPCDVTVTIKGNTGTYEYDGTEKTVEGYTAKIDNDLYTEADFKLVDSQAKIRATVPGTYQMVLTPENFENTNRNFNVTFVVKPDGKLTITKRDVTLTSASASKPYDGTALTNKNVTVGGNGFADGEGATYNVTGSQTEVGKSDNEFTYELNANTKASNYNITMYKGELVITAADSVAYKVEHYKQNLDGSYNDTPNDIDPLSGTAGTLTAAAAKDYPGFTPGTVTQEKIKSDGTTTIKIQYTRNSYTLTINYVYRDGSKAAESHIETILYGKDYSVTSPKISGYTADKLVVSGTMPAENITVKVTYTKNGGHHPRPKPTVEIEDDDALGLNTTDHFAYIVGYGNGEVRPQNNITRAEVATIFFRLLTDDVRDENLTKTNRYSDVTRADWYNTAVSTLSSMGIITGYPDGTFRPNAAITRAEFAAIAARFDSNGDKTTAKFSDIATHWAKDEISIAYNNGWITGYPDGTFGPQRDITRAETMTLVNRVLNRQPETEDDLLPNMTVWTDNANPKAWYYLAVQEATNSHYYEFKTNSQYEKWTELRETRDWSQLEK